ncbi:hypothetical protein [Actinoplanes sp. NBRC 103695]|uniref:hypothetical protein n=1 Tax=Actinoplanes sp. NBRC 103695 TaxID=3032202 RepID=UPI0024A339F5|nr:hypothetical protein [Actinoplanes sp. NBRC 103695]GLY97642.1 hypothetical protein Acsp02_48960 [Actinoplanes sp. NBRC 103695]
MSANHPDSATLDVLRDELKTLKDEQRDRIRARDNMIYSLVLAIAAVVGGTRLAGPAALLLLPPVALVLGWTYLTNDQKVSAIGRYLRTDLAIRIGALVGTDVLRWETAHRNDRRRRQRKGIQLAVDLTVFVLPAAAALIGYWVNGPSHALLLLVSILEATAVLISAWQLVAYADLTPASAGDDR